MLRATFSHIHTTIYEDLVDRNHDDVMDRNQAALLVMTREAGKAEFLRGVIIGYETQIFFGDGIWGCTLSSGMNSRRQGISHVEDERYV